MRSRTRASRFIAICLVAVAVVGSSASEGLARADEPAPERARQEYQDAIAAYGLGKFAEAAKLFESAYRALKMPTMLFDVAQSHRKIYELGNLDIEPRVAALQRAIDMYKAFLRDAPSTAAKRPAAEQLLSKLEPELTSAKAKLTRELVKKCVGKEGLFIVDKLISEGYYKEAGQGLDNILAQRKNTRDLIVAALERRGAVGAHLNQTVIAVEAFHRALLLEPGFRFTDESEPQGVKAFTAALERMKSSRPISLSHVPVGELARSEPMRVVISEISDPLSMISQLGLYFRVAGGGAFSAVYAAPSAGRVEVPASFLSSLRGGTKVEYYVVALDDNEGELYLSGSPKEPFVASVARSSDEMRAEAPKKPVYKRAWFWGVMGSVIVVAGVGVGLGVYFGTLNNPSDVYTVP